MIFPDQFIPVAEKSGWINALTQEILQQSFLSFAALPESLTLAVNISPLQLRDFDLPKQIHRIAAQTGFQLNRLVVEITESALMDNMEDARTIVKELKSMGCKLALDDFGTGYSSLLHLQAFPFDELKVDRSFVSSMMERRESRKIVGAVIALGQNLGLTTIAEGIERVEQAELLRWLGCDIGQGWLYGHPMPAEHLQDFIAKPRLRIPSSKRIPWKATSLEDFGGLPSQRLAQLQAVYDGAPVGLAFINKNLQYININQRLAEIKGIAVDEHLGRAVSEIIPAEFFKNSESYYRRALAGEAISDVEMTTTGAGGLEIKILLLSFQPVSDEVGEIIGISISVVDITGRKRTEEALRESEDHYRHMVDLNPQILWVMDEAGQNIEVSPRWVEITGLSMEQTRGEGWLDVLHPDDKAHVTAIIESSLRSGQIMDMEYRIRRLDSGWRWMRSRSAPRFDTSGQIIRWYGSIEDIDERKQTEEALRARLVRT